MTVPSDLIVLAPDWRVRPCDQLQWVLERRSIPGGGRWKHRAAQLKHDGEPAETWLPYAYCGTKAGLETALSRLRCDGIVLDPAPLASLPARFNDGGEQ